MPALRACLAIAGLTVVTLILLPLQWLAVRFRWQARRWIPVLFHRVGCRLLGVRITEHGRLDATRPLLVAANHVSWLDIVVLGSRVPLSFIAKSEVATWPLFGTFARLQRTVFVDRQRRSATGRTNSEIAERLTNGDAMVLFAEGTSSDGSRVLPFRSALIGAAQAALTGNGDAGPETVWVQPLAVVYTKLQGLPLDRRTRPLIGWYGDMDLAPHLWRLMKEGAVDVELIWGEPVAVSPSTNRKALAAELEQTVRDAVNATLLGREPEPRINSADEVSALASPEARQNIAAPQ